MRLVDDGEILPVGADVWLSLAREPETRALVRVVDSPPSRRSARSSSGVTRDLRHASALRGSDRSAGVRARAPRGVAVARVRRGRARAPWVPKLEANRSRDEKNLARLQSEGWQVLVIWECELGDLASVTNRVEQFLKEPS